MADSNGYHGTIITTRKNSLLFAYNDTSVLDLEVYRAAERGGGGEKKQEQSCEN